MKILISAGHSNTDPGAVANGHVEAVLVTDFRNMVAYYMRDTSHQVVTNGVAQENKSLSQTLKLIPGTDLAIEFHCNAASNANAKGVESISQPALKSVSQRLSASVSSVLGHPLRGEQGWIDQRQSAHGELAFVKAGGVIVELFFLTNKQELGCYLERKWLVAKSVAAAIIESMSND